MITVVTTAFAAGLIGSPHCIGMCGGFAVLCGKRVPDTMLWHAGRMTSYAGLGALAGAFGAMLPGPSWVAAVVSLGLMVWFAAGLAGLVPEPRLVVPGLRHLGATVAGSPASGMRFAFGIVNGFLPCGLVYTALGIPVATGDPALGALAMVAFGLGTTPLLSVVALGVHRVVARDLRVRRLLAAAVLAAGLWSIGLRQGVLGEGHVHQGAAETEMEHVPQHEGH